MTPKLESTIYAGTCFVIVLLSVAGLIYGVHAGLLFSGGSIVTVDGLLLALVCLAMGGLFSIFLVVILRKEGWLARLPHLRKREAAAPDGQPAREEAK